MNKINKTFIKEIYNIKIWRNYLYLKNIISYFLKLKFCVKNNTLIFYSLF